MADDIPTPEPKPDVRAGGTLDLSTGRPAPPPPEPPAPLPPAPADSDVKAGRTLNLSTGKPSTSSARRKPAAASLGPGPVVRETLDLSTKTAPPPAPDIPKAEAPPPAKPNRSRPKGDGPRGSSSNRSRPSRDVPASASSSLADLLDPDVLAKLRGG